MSEKPIAEKKPFDENIELQKIQALESEFQTWFNIAGSIWATGFIALAVLWLTLYYEGRLNFFKNGWYNVIIAIVGVLIIYIVTAEYGLSRMKKVSNKFWDNINELLVKVEKGERLDSLTKLRERILGKKRARH